MEKPAFTFGGHCGRGVDIFRSVNQIHLQYGFVGERKIELPADFELSISKEDAIKLATRLLSAADEE